MSKTCITALVGYGPNILKIATMPSHSNYGTDQ